MILDYNTELDFDATFYIDAAEIEALVSETYVHHLTLEAMVSQIEERESYV